MITFNFVFLALVTGSTPSSPCGTGSFEPALGFGKKQVILSKVATLTAGHSVALKFISPVLPCRLLISFLL